jgi:putative FmdB family regulatory protein
MKSAGLSGGITQVRGFLMPVYEYECRKCAKRFEVARGFHETGGGVCPDCGRKGQRIYSVPPLLFKGSGFYVTDHRKKTGQPDEGKPAAKGDAKPAGDAGPGKAEKPAKSKPEPKVDAD